MFSKFLEELDLKSIRISFREGKLTYEGPEENITADLLAKLRKYKESLIRYHWPADCANMMPINPLGNKIPFVLVYFEVMNYPLSEYLGKDQPFYGFLPYGSNGEKVKYKSVEAFAAEYIRQLQKIIPRGPYFLGGFSFGGVLAFEMAIQLQRAGYEVPFLTLLDSKTSKAFEYISWHSNIFKIIKSNILGPMKRKMIDQAKLLTCQLFFFINKPIPISLRNFYIVGKYRELTLKYKPDYYRGEILLFRAEEANLRYEYNGWETHADKVNLVTFKGTHLAIAREKEYSDLLGNEFLNHLDKVYKSSVT